MAWIRDMFHSLCATTFLIGRDETAVTQHDCAPSERHPHTLNWLRNYDLLLYIWPRCRPGDFWQLYYADYTSTGIMASPNDRQLCNRIPIDQHLKRFLSSAKQRHSCGVGKHANIIETFGSTLVRDNRTNPTKDEAGFAAWLAKPDMTGGLAVARQQQPCHLSSLQRL